MQIFRDWFKRHFNDPQILILIAFLVIGTLAMITVGGNLAPVLAGVVIAYLLEGLVGLLTRLRLPRLAAVLIVFCTFMTAMLYLLFGLLPKISSQMGQVVGELPAMVARGQNELMHLPDRYPELISQAQIEAAMDIFRTELARLGQAALTVSVASVRGIMTFVVYLILVPLMVFFFLKDKEPILNWFYKFLPENRGLSIQVWREVNTQIGNYTRGKFWEILIIWSVSYVTFAALGLDFAMLLSLGVGLSVLVPYIGAVFITFPVIIIAYFQWGWGSEFIYVVIAYLIIQLLDGNLLVPLLLSEVVNLHPVAIIAAVLFFGGLWGFWGVFFAIPLATLVQAVMRAWSHRAVGDPDNLRPPDEDLQAPAA